MHPRVHVHISARADKALLTSHQIVTLLSSRESHHINMWHLFILNLFFSKKSFHPGRNEPLKKERPKWKSEYPMTEGQLRSKRDEFWDTAPAFDGRKEIWDALRAAALAAECNDLELAQAIVDGACITLPHGMEPPTQTHTHGNALPPWYKTSKLSMLRIFRHKYASSFNHSEDDALLVQRLLLE